MSVARYPALRKTLTASATVQHRVNPDYRFIPCHLPSSLLNDPDLFLHERGQAGSVPLLTDRAAKLAFVVQPLHHGSAEVALNLAGSTVDRLYWASKSWTVSCKEVRVRTGEADVLKVMYPRLYPIRQAGPLIPFVISQQIKFQDRFGARKVFRAAIVIFTLGSAACGSRKGCPISSCSASFRVWVGR